MYLWGICKHNSNAVVKRETPRCTNNNHLKSQGILIGRHGVSGESSHFILNTSPSPCQHFRGSNGKI